MSYEQQIRTLIEAWARAAHEGDMDAVLADHAPDIVMFDVPPPQRGVRGLDAYRESWPGFFRWQASGAVFEIEELDITAGADVAFAYALLRCGTTADSPATPNSACGSPSASARPTEGGPSCTSTTRSRTRPAPPTRRRSDKEALADRGRPEASNKPDTPLMCAVRPRRGRRQR
jgi:ketosteroid isomerase-like protein